MKGIIVRAAIVYAFCVLGAYSTTDILRLINGAKLPVWNPSCYCPLCKAKIRLIEQIPIFSYIFSRGRCRNCNNKIPLSELFLEVFIIAGFTALSLCMGFSWQCFIFCIAIYELLKIGCCLVFGVRKDGFAKNFIYSLFMNALMFTIIAFLFLLIYTNQ